MLTEQAKASGRDEIIEKMVEGRLRNSTRKLFY